MKLKFKAKPQDWLIFFLFAIILLYIVAIAVLNIATLAGNPPAGSNKPMGTFWGLNPFPAFTFSSNNYILYWSCHCNIYRCKIILF